MVRVFINKSEDTFSFGSTEDNTLKGKDGNIREASWWFLGEKTVSVTLNNVEKTFNKGSLINYINQYIDQKGLKKIKKGR